MATLYDDDFVTITEQQIVIKNYKFPTRRSRHILVDNIDVVYFELQGQGKCKKKSCWGMTDNHIWWASDFKRCMPCSGKSITRANIVLDTGSQHKCGFTTSNLDEFLDALRTVISHTVIIIDSINI